MSCHPVSWCNHPPPRRRQSREGAAAYLAVEAHGVLVLALLVALVALLLEGLGTRRVRRVRHASPARRQPRGDLRADFGQLRLHSGQFAALGEFRLGLLDDAERVLEFVLLHQRPRPVQVPFGELRVEFHHLLGVARRLAPEFLRLVGGRPVGVKNVVGPVEADGHAVARHRLVHVAVFEALVARVLGGRRGQRPLLQELCAVLVRRRHRVDRLLHLCEQRRVGLRQLQQAFEDDDVPYAREKKGWGEGAGGGELPTGGDAQLYVYAA